MTLRPYYALLLASSALIVAAWQRVDGANTSGTSLGEIETKATVAAEATLSEQFLTSSQHRQQAQANNDPNGSRRSRAFISTATQEASNGAKGAGVAAQQHDLSTGLAGYLLAEPTDKQLNLSDPIDAKLLQLLGRIGPDIRPPGEFREFDDVGMEVAKRAWVLMRQHAHLAAVDRVKLISPVIYQLLRAAKVSERCETSARLTLEAARDFESWAIQLLNAWGSFPPTGVYEGTFGDIGSFHGCLNVPESAAIEHAHYCSISYRPVMPARRDYELVVRKEPDELRRLFVDSFSSAMNAGSKQQANDNGRVDAFTDLLGHAQYNHYVYYKLGTCMPIGCSPVDVQKIARLLGKRSILLSGPVKCYSKFAQDYTKTSQSDDNKANKTSDGNGGASRELKISVKDLNDGVYIWKPHITSAQWVSFVIVVSITSAIAALTIVDLLVNRSGEFFKSSASKGEEGDDKANKLQEIGNSPVVLCARSMENSNKSAIIAEEEEDFNNNNNNTGGVIYEMKGVIRDDNNNNELGAELVEDRYKTIPLDDNNNNNNNNNNISRREEADKGHGAERKQVAESTADKKPKKKSFFSEIASECSIITNTQQFFRISQSQLSNDILCINGIRCITMSWIIVTHTMQYNDWSAFARILEVETHLRSLVNQPVFNASYLVDSFFLVSGLLTSFSCFKGRDTLTKFSARSYLIGRYLRLTPQILFTSLLFILLPLLLPTASPHWYTMTGEFSENCSQNWWINLLHIQAFYKTNEMCNYVCWWISVDMLYHLFALAIILVIVRFQRPQLAIESCLVLGLGHVCYEAMRHYQLKLPPNLLSTIPQIGAMWSQMTLDFFWQPYAHALPFFVGFYVGYLMARHHAHLSGWFSKRRAIAGWTLALTLLVGQSYSTYFWVVGDWQYSRLGATIFYLTCPLIWAGCLSWIILACQFGYGGWANAVLSCRLFVILGKASYIVYLSHFMVLFGFYGSQNLLLEPTQLVMLYVMFGNIFLSMLLGCILCICFEMPWLRIQKRIMRYVR